MAEPRTDASVNEAYDDLDALFVDPTRLRLLAFLVTLDEAEFRVVADRLNLSDSALSKQISTLRQSDVVTVRKERRPQPARTVLAMTPAGRHRFSAHLAALQAIAQGASHVQDDSTGVDPGE